MEWGVKEYTCGWLWVWAVCPGQPLGLGFCALATTLWALPRARGVGLLGEGPEETHHLTGGEAESLMAETETHKGGSQGSLVCTPPRSP